MLSLLIGLAWAMDRTAFVYIARGELQRAELLLQRAAQRRMITGAPFSMVDALHLISTGVLAVMQGRFKEGQTILSELLLGIDQAHLKG